MEVIKLDKNNCNLIGRIVDVFLKNEKAIIYLGDNLECDNNQLIKEILSKMSIIKKSNIR